MTPQEAQEKISQLSEQINYHNDLYYQKNTSEISDYDFDKLLESLIALSGGDTTNTYRVLKDGEPVGELDMRDLVRSLVPRISSGERGAA